MKDFFISCIQQVGVGTVDFRRSWNWLIQMFGAETKILEDDTVAERMLPYTGNQPQKRHACIAVNVQGGGGFEIWQYSEREPLNAKFEIGIGEIGIFGAKVKCTDVRAFRKQLLEHWNRCGEVEQLPDGTLCLYVQDLYGNLYQLVEDKHVFIRNGRLTGGVVGAMVGVTDMKASMRFYGDILGYDTVVYDQTDIFKDWKMWHRGTEQYRRVLLRRSKKTEGAFSELFGESTIELVQAIDRVPKKIYEGRYWGDPGFIQLCFDVTGMQALGKFCAKKGRPFTVDSCPDGEVFNMGEAAGHFTYIEDPDGTLIEFVETHKIPVVKKLNWYLDLRKRDRRKPLPKFLFRLMALVSKETIKN